MTDKPKTILIIEDEKDILELYTTILTNAGYVVVSAEDGEDGLLKAKSEDWDIMLLDIMLPKLDGLGVLKAVKDNLDTSNKKIILLTNLGRESLITQGFDEGADAYLMKSELNPDQLLDEIKKVGG
jgi:two-component system, OmpR family, alkaline phosphatase synthesis response regulator PhoP